MRSLDELVCFSGLKGHCSWIFWLASAAPMSSQPNVPPRHSRCCKDRADSRVISRPATSSVCTSLSISYTRTHFRKIKQIDGHDVTNKTRKNAIEVQENEVSTKTSESSFKH